MKPLNHRADDSKRPTKTQKYEFLYEVGESTRDITLDGLDSFSARRVASSSTSLLQQRVHLRNELCDGSIIAKLALELGHDRLHILDILQDRIDILLVDVALEPASRRLDLALRGPVSKSRER